MDRSTTALISVLLWGLAAACSSSGDGGSGAPFSPDSSGGVADVISFGGDILIIDTGAVELLTETGEPWWGAGGRTKIC